MAPARRAHHGLAHGHRTNVQTIKRWVTERGETKSTAARLAVLTAAGWILCQAIGRTPGILWALVLGWGIAAWRSARPGPDTLGEPTPASAVTPQQAIARWIAERIGDRPGIHLAELYPAMRQLDGMAEHDDAALRGALRELDITVTRSMRVGDVEGRSGIRLKDLTPLLSPTGETTPSPSGDARQKSGEHPESAPESAGERTGEEAKTP